MLFLEGSNAAYSLALLVQQFEKFAKRQLA